MGYGFGWRLVAFDARTRAGVVALGDERLPFDAAAAMGEVLEVGGEVFVRLQPSAGSTHVARVWPCLAQLPVPAGALGARDDAPARDPSADARLASLLVAIPAPFVAVVSTEPERTISVAAGRAWRNAYGLAGWDVSYHGELRCEGATSTATGAVRVACARPANARERAWLHAGQGLGTGDVALALCERRGDLEPSIEARLVLISARSITWQPAPPRERLAEIERALAEARATSVRVSRRSLFALVGEEVVASIPLTSDDEARALSAWGRFVAPILRGDDVDWELP